MLVTMSFGDRVLTNTTVSGRKPKPVCMALPGGISQFCGRIYGISRQGEEFKACLGLELRALDDIEAALRVSCFKFGPKGVNLEAAPPVPSDEKEKEEDDDDDDDYGLDDDDDDDDEEDDDDDAFGLDVDDDDDDEEEDTAAASQDNEVDSDDSADYAGFSVLGEEIFGLFGDDDSGTKKKKKIKTAKPVKQITTTKRPLLLPNRPTRPNRPQLVTVRPVNRITRRPIKDKDVSKPSAPVPAVVAPQPSTTITPTETNSAVTTDSNLKSTEMSIDTSSQEPSSAAPTTAATTTTTTTEKANTADLSLLQTDLAKVEAVAAIAQQDVAAPVLVPSTTPAPKMTPKPSVAEMLKNNMPASPVDDEVSDEDDLFDGMIGAVDDVATIVEGDSDKQKPTKKVTVTQGKKETDNTKKGNLQSSSINAKPVKKPEDDDDDDDDISDIDIFGDDDADDDEEGDDDETDDDETDDEDTDEEDSNEDETSVKPSVQNKNKNKNKVQNDDDEDDPINLFDSVIGDDDEGETEEDQKKPNDASEESEESDEDDAFGLDVDDDDNDDENDEDDDKAPVVEASSTTTTTQLPPAKVESNLVDSEEAGTPEIDEVTDYDSGEDKTQETTNATPTTTVTASEAVKTQETDEKAAEPISKTEAEEEDEESTDLEIEDIGLGADDEERQIKKIRQIVGEAKRGLAPSNWSIFLRPARRFSTGPLPGSARGDRSSRVHRRMNLERVS